MEEISLFGSKKKFPEASQEVSENSPRWCNPPVAEVKEFSAPDDGVVGEAPDPEEETEQIAEWEQIDVAQDLTVSKNAYSD